MNSIYFSETQRFRSWWPWAAAIVLNGIFIFAIVQQIIFGNPFGDKPAPDFVLVLLEIFSVLFIVLLFSIRLTTSYDESGIRYRFYPFQLRATQIDWEELSDAYLREYNSLYEFGGWGIRIGSATTGRAINTSESCNQGLQLVFKNGNLLLIGTKNPAALQEIIEKIHQDRKINWV